MCIESEVRGWWIVQLTSAPILVAISRSLHSSRGLRSYIAVCRGRFPQDIHFRSFVSVLGRHWGKFNSIASSPCRHIFSVLPYGTVGPKTVHAFTITSTVFRSC